MTGHTPGPWERQGRIIVAGGDLIVADTVSGICPPGFAIADTDERVANARLIASSPDLLAALEDAVMMLAEYHKVSPEIDPANAEHLDACDMGAIGDQGGCAHCHAVKKARAAIAKARGEGR